MPRRARRHEDRWLVAWAVASVAAGVASLLVPLYVVALGGGPVALGVLASTAAATGAPGAVLAGRLGDRTGAHRRIVLAALLAVAVLLLVLPATTGILAAIVVNAGVWLAWGALAPVLTMLVLAGHEESAWPARIARLNTYQGYGWAGGLVLGAVWTAGLDRVRPTAFAHRSLFVVCAVLVAGAWLLAGRALPPSRAPAVPTPTPVQARRIARALQGSRRSVKGATFALSPNRLYWTTRAVDPRRLGDRLTPALSAYFLAAALFFTGTAAFWAPLPVYLTGAGFDPGAIFGLYLISSLASAALYGTAGRWSATYDVRYVHGGALGVRAVCFPIVAVVAAGPLVAPLVGHSTTGIAFALIGATWAVIAVAGTAIVTRLAPASVRGEVLGFYTALAAVGGGIGGALGGVLAARGFVLAFAVAGGLVLLGGGLVVAIRRFPAVPGASDA